MRDGAPILRAGGVWLALTRLSRCLQPAHALQCGRCAYSRVQKGMPRRTESLPIQMRVVHVLPDARVACGEMARASSFRAGGVAGPAPPLCCIVIETLCNKTSSLRWYPGQLSFPP